MTWFTLFGRKHCKVCSTATIIKRDGKYVCVNVNHAANVTRAANRQAAAQASAGRRGSGKPAPVKYCPSCGVRLLRFQGEKGYIWKCPHPQHAARVRVKKRRIIRRARTSRKKKK